MKILKWTWWNPLILVFGLLASLSQQALAQVRMIHTPVIFARENQPIDIAVRIEGGIAASDEMRVYYRTQLNNTYTYIVLDNVGDEFRGQLPAQSMAAVKVEYFISLIKGGNVYTLPETNPYYEPFELQITPGKEVQETPPQALPEQPAGQTMEGGLPLGENDYLILSPENGQTVDMEEVVIAVSLFLDSTAIDVYQTRFLIDRRQVKPELSPELISYVPPRISEGWHDIELRLFRPDGQGYQPIRWRFRAVSATRIGMRRVPLIAGASGNFYAESRTEKYSGLKLVNNLIGGQFRGRKAGLNYGARFYLTSLEDRNFQPRNRFLVWLDAKLVKIYLGDTSPQFSELILAGKRVRGINAQLNLKIINFDFVKGQTYRAVEGGVLTQYYVSPITHDTLYIDPTTGDTLYSRIRSYGTYEQNLLGLKTSFGNPGGNHFGVSLLKVKDDVHSIRNGLKPKDNLVAGVELELALFRNRFRWRTDLAFSLLTDDISTGAITKSQLDSLIEGEVPIDPADYEKYLILNASTIPLDPTTGSSIAYLSTLQASLLNNQVLVKYKSIGSKYNSLGNPFIRKNIRGLLISDRIRLFRNRVYLNLGYEKYKDNFSQEDGNPILNLETIQYGISFYPGGGIPNLNINHRTYTRDNNVIIFDQTVSPTDNRENNTQNELTFNISYDFNLFNLNHNLSLNYITLDKKDAFAASRMPVPYYFPLGIDNNIQSFTLQTRYQIPLTTTISFANNKNSYLGNLNRFDFTNLDLRADYSLLQKRLNLYAGFRRFHASGGTNTSQPGANFLGLTKIDYSKTQFDAGARLTLKQRHIFALDLSTINFQDNGGYTDITTGLFVPNPSYHDYSLRLRYELQF